VSFPSPACSFGSRERGIIYSNIRLFTEKNTPQPKARGPAIPKKRARKVKAMEFGSDDE
jgi:hypothetical protein